MDLTNQAKIIIFLGLLQFIISLDITPKSFVPLVFFIILIVTALNTYTVNCMVVGKCDTFSWILVGASIISILILFKNLWDIKKLNKTGENQYLLIRNF